MYDLEQAVFQTFRQPEDFPSLAVWPKSESQFRLWRYPAFSAYTTWLVRRSSTQFQVRRLEWDRLTDGRFPSTNPRLFGKPTIYGSDALLPDEPTIALIEQVKLFQLEQLKQKPMIACDGVIIGLQTYFESGRQAEWWGNPPAGWEALGDWFAKTTAFLDSHLPQSTARMNH